MPLNQLPQPARPGVVGRALRQHQRRPQRAGADHLPWAHDPAHVGHPHEPVVSADVGLKRALLGDLDQEPAVHVHRALGPARGARRVDHHHRRLRVEWRRGQLRRLARHQLVPVVVAPAAHRRPRAQPVPHHDVPHRRRMVERRVGDLLHRDRLAAAGHGVGRQQRHRTRVAQPRRHRRRAEAGEDRHRDRADLADRVEARHHLHRHRQEQADRLAGLDPKLQQRVADAVDLGLELAVADRAHLAVLALPDHCGAVGVVAGVPVDAVVRQVDPAAAEPARPHRPVAVVIDLRVGRRELQPQMRDHGVPEPGDVVLRPATQIPPVGDPLLTHEGRHPGAIDHLRRRRPDHTLHR